MTAPTFNSFCTVLCGWLFARRHTVTGALRACGGGGAPAKHHSAYHRVFAAARWSLDAVGLAMLALVLNTPGLLGGHAAMPFLVVDDTVCRRRGWRMFGVDSHYDAAGTGRKLSNANRSLKVRGHCWVVLGIVVPVPFRPGHHVCLPLLFRLYMNKRAAAANGKPYRGKPHQGRDLVKIVAAAACPGRPFHLLVDSAYAGQKTLRALPAGWEMTARWQTKVKLCAPPPPPPPADEQQQQQQQVDAKADAKGDAKGDAKAAADGRGRRSAVARRGEPLPTPAEMIDRRPCDERLELDVFGNRQRYRVATCQACLNTVPGRVLRVVVTELLTRGGRGRPDRQAVVYSTAADASAEEVLTWYALRWSVEVTFRDAKQQLGCGGPQAWTELGVTRSTPTLLLAYAAVVLWYFRDGHRRWRGGPRVAAGWYPHKGDAVSFADMLATLRRATLRHALKADLRAAAAACSPRKAVRALFNLVSLAA
jgi:hypothetical protein